jgi:hypothetical protein
MQKTTARVAIVAYIGEIASISPFQIAEISEFFVIS